MCCKLIGHALFGLVVVLLYWLLGWVGWLSILGLYWLGGRYYWLVGWLWCGMVPFNFKDIWGHILNDCIILLNSTIPFDDGAIHNNICNNQLTNNMSGPGQIPKIFFWMKGYDIGWFVLIDHITISLSQQKSFQLETIYICGSRSYYFLDHGKYQEYSFEWRNTTMDGLCWSTT